MTTYLEKADAHLRAAKWSSAGATGAAIGVLLSVLSDAFGGLVATACTVVAAVAVVAGVGLLIIGIVFGRRASRIKVDQ